MVLGSPGLQDECLYQVKCLVDPQEFGLETQFVYR